jgi:hypothetical protein
MSEARHHKQAAEAATRIQELFVEWAELDRMQTSGEFGTITQRARWAGLEAEIDSLLHALSFTAHPAPMDRVTWRANARISNYATA